MIIAGGRSDARRDPSDDRRAEGWKAGAKIKTETLTPSAAYVTRIQSHFSEACRLGGTILGAARRSEIVAVHAMGRVLIDQRRQIVDAVLNRGHGVPVEAMRGRAVGGEHAARIVVVGIAA